MEFDDEDYNDHQLVCDVVPDKRSAAGLVFVAALVPEEHSRDADVVAWIRLDLSSFEICRKSYPYKSEPVGIKAEMETVSARTDVASPDGRTWFIPAAYPRDDGRLSHLKLMRSANDRSFDDALFELRDDATSPAECTWSRGYAATTKFHEHFTYRSVEDCYHVPPAFLVGNCVIVYSARATQPKTRAKFTVWRF